MSGTAIVAGVGPTIGEAVARELHAGGYEVGLFARSAEFVAELASDLGDGALAVSTDVTDPEAVAEGTARVREAFGPIEALVVNASGGSGNPVDGATVDRLRELFEVRVAGSPACVEAALDDLRETGGTVVVSGTTYADGHAAEQVEWGAVAPAARGRARSLDDAVADVQFTYVEIGTAVAPAGVDRPNAVAADEIAATYRHLVEQDAADTRECTIDRRR